MGMTGYRPYDKPAEAGWLSPAQAARRLGVTPQWARKLAQVGRLTGVETALGWLIDPQSVAQMVGEREERRDEVQ